MAFDTTSSYTISWIYAAAFGRTPVPNSALPDNGDLGGLTFWTDAYLAGVDAFSQFNGNVDAIADFFVQSDEFLAKYPASLTSSDFVTALYNNMLDRAPEPAGLAFWVGQLDTGATRGQVLADFSNVAENQDSNPARKAGIISFIQFIDADPDNTVTPAEATTWLADNPNSDGAIVDSVLTLTGPSSVKEGEVGAFVLEATFAATMDRTFDVGLVGDTFGGAVVGATVSGTDSDFVTPIQSQVTILAGETSGTISIGARADNVAETNEGFKVSVLDGATTVVSATALVLDVAADITPPVINAGQTVSYGDGQVAGTVLGTVEITDEVAVTGVTIVSGNDKGYFAINTKGEVSLTAAGAAAGAASNDFNVLPNSFDLVLRATDGAGNKSTDTTVTLAEKDTVPPTLNTATLGGTAITLTFNEALDPASIPAPNTFTVLQNGSTAVAVSTVTVSGSSVTLTLAAVPAGTVTVGYTTPATSPLQDLAGNDVVTISGRTVLVDVGPPTLDTAALSPLDNAVDVAVDANIVIAFSETIKAGTGNITLNSLSGIDNRTFALSDPQVKISGNTVTINPTTDLAAGVDYNIQLADGVILDTSGNKFAGITNATTFNFTTKQPTLSDLTSGSDIMSGNVFDGTLDILSGQSVETLTSGDRLTGTGVNTTLNAEIQQYTHTVTPLSVVGIGTVNVTASTLLPTGPGAGAPTLNFANVDSSTKNFSLSGQTNDFTLTNIINAIGAFGINNVGLGGVGGTADFTATFQNAALSGSTDSTTVTLNQVPATTGVADAILTFQPTSAGSSGFETINLVSAGGIPNAITLTDGTGNSLTTVNATGSQALTVALLDTTVTKVDASALTGVLTLTAAAANAQNMTVTGGTGNDVINLNGYNTSDVINGGDGTSDRLVLTNAQAIAATTKQTNVSNIEVIGLANASAMTALWIAGLGIAPSGLNAPAATPVALANFGATGLRLGTSTDTTADGDIADVTDINSGLGADSVVNYAAGTGTLELQNSPSNTFSLTLNVAGTATSDVINVKAGTTTSGILTGAAAAANDTAGWGTGDIIINGAETVNLTSQGGANTLDVFTLTATAATETLNILGGQNLTFTGAVTADVIDASAFTGNLTMGASTLPAGGITLKGGSGADLLFGSAGADIITGGAGNDRIVGAGSQAALVANQADVLAGGAGADTFVFYDTLAAAATVSNATAGAVVKVTDFVAGTDKFALLTGGPATSVVVNTAQTIGTADTVAAVSGAITAIPASVVAGALQAVVVTVSAGVAAGTYLYVNDAAGAVSPTNDILINITGLSGTITASDFVFA